MKEKIEDIIKYLKKTDEKTVLRLAHEIQGDEKVSFSQNKEDAVKFFSKWLPTIDDAWLNQIWGGIRKIGTFGNTPDDMR